MKGSGTMGRASSPWQTVPCPYGAHGDFDERPSGRGPPLTLMTHRALLAFAGTGPADLESVTDFGQQRGGAGEYEAGEGDGVEVGEGGVQVFVVAHRAAEAALQHRRPGLLPAPEPHHHRSTARAHPGGSPCAALGTLRGALRCL